MQNIKNFWHADPEISALPTDRWTDERTDEAEFKGPFRLKPWVQLRRLLACDTSSTAVLKIHILFATC